MKEYDVAVIGAGAGGLMAAGTAVRRGLNVAIIEKNAIWGKKLLITGKGRCNVTNNCTIEEFIDNIPVNASFLYSSFKRFTSQDTMEFFENLGVPLKTERGKRVFPASDKSSDIVNALKRYASGCFTVRGTVKELIIEDGKLLGVKLEDNRSIMANKVIIATGGKSYPLTGSTGDGYILAKQAGHTIIDPKPSLVPLNAADSFCAQMQGLSLKNVSIKVIDNLGKIHYSDFGELLFTHFGLSGPLILSASSHIRDFSKLKFHILIDLKPALDIEKLDERLMKDFAKYAKKDFINSLDDLFPRKMIPVIAKMSGIPLDKKTSDITKEQRKHLAGLIKGLRVDIDSPRPIDEAIITSGGVAVSQVNPKTMESKLLPGLFFAGEVLDVDAYTGGFNLQIAFSTAYSAGCCV